MSSTRHLKHNNFMRYIMMIYIIQLSPNYILKVSVLRAWLGWVVFNRPYRKFACYVDAWQHYQPTIMYTGIYIVSLDGAEIMDVFRRYNI